MENRKIHLNGSNAPTQEAGGTEYIGTSSPKSVRQKVQSSSSQYYYDAEKGAFQGECVGSRKDTKTFCQEGGLGLAIL